jgi:lipid-binding SYLF domain-containing protein
LSGGYLTGRLRPGKEIQSKKRRKAEQSEESNNEDDNSQLVEEEAIEEEFLKEALEARCVLRNPDGLHVGLNLGGRLRLGLTMNHDLNLTLKT